ncbi:vegetative incompatibility protein HET-E-1 [Dichotomopilus funicola]|uniref:Vegetative incompatibility protein HET-E-1 n=1 Tax=Dichotomopilus funicola TaxID=1934379 RepID=A0AAN6UW20_9PEZI|nr:vegetative incompatibility protein HET-E-1 [Dichotomopilus funicola]
MKSLLCFRRKAKKAEVTGKERSHELDFVESPRIPPFPTGVDVLHDCPDATVDICFVHGLSGDRNSTWTADGQSVPWPKTFLPLKLRNARILTFGYDAYVVPGSGPSANRLLDHAMSLLARLTTNRRTNNASTRPLIFVAHGLGGIVCKEAILSSRDNPELHLRGIFDYFKGIIFMGTPHKGSSMAGWARIPASAFGIVKQVNKPLLQILQTNDQFLESIHLRFLGMLREQREEGRALNVTCFAEELPVPPIGLLVTKDSAHFDGYNHITIHANHNDMTKFASMQDDGFVMVTGELIRWGKEIERSRPLLIEPPSSQPSPSSVEIGLGGPLRIGYGYGTNSIKAASANTRSFYYEDRLELPSLRDLSAECHRSLAFPEMCNQSSDIDSAVKGTCEWVNRHETYRTWAVDHHGLLCIKGKPGSGKSTLLKYAVKNHRIGDGDFFLSFFFRGLGDELLRSPLGLFRSLLHQLFSLAPRALSNLVHAFKKRCKEFGNHDEKWSWHEEELRGYLEACLYNVLETHPVWLFVDALDECGKDNAVKVVDMFKTLLNNLRSRSIGLKPFRICFSCRHYPILDLDDTFEICLEDENDKDISTFVNTQLGAFQARTGSTIPALITARASGVFLWARLVVKRVRDLELEGAGLNEIEGAVHAVPPDLRRVYRNLIPDMGPASLKLIQWICFASRPLTIDEMRWAMVIDSDSPCRSLQAYETDENYVPDTTRMERKVRTLSMGLAEVSHTGEIQFIHQSLKDFFLEDGLSVLDDNVTSAEAAIRGHFRLFKICLRYLAMEELNRPANPNSDDFALLHYASTEWMAHAARSDPEVSAYNELLASFHWPSNEVVNSWLYAYKKSELFGRPESYGVPCCTLP